VKIVHVTKVSKGNVASIFRAYPEDTGSIFSLRLVTLHTVSRRYSRGVRFLENAVNTEKANTELFHLHLHYAWMPLLITKIIKNESRENKEAASPCWSLSATLRGRRLEIFCLLLMVVNSREVPVNGKKMGYTLFRANKRTREHGTCG
jgi:hypothetical protein